MNGCILAGGKNSRMNYKVKALLKYKEETFLSRTLKVLDGLENFIISNNKEVFCEIDIPIYEDIIKDIGPLGGIYTALKMSKEDKCMIVGCDMPFIGRELIKKIISYKEYDVVIPRVDGKYEPLCAMYSKSCIPVIEKLIGEKRYKLTSILDSVRVKCIDYSVDDLSYFININTPEEYEKL